MARGCCRRWWDCACPWFFIPTVTSAQACRDGWRAKRYFTRDASVIAACRFVAEPWTKFVPRERVKVIYNGVAGPARTAERPSSVPRIGCIGRIAPEKGQREFLRVAAIVHRALPGCGSSCAAPPLFFRPAARNATLPRCARKRQGLPVEFTGWVADVRRAGRTRSIAGPIHRPEATTRVIPEAYAAGVPVIAFPSGGIPEVGRRPARHVGGLNGAHGGTGDRDPDGSRRKDWRGCPKRQENSGVRVHARKVPSGGTGDNRVGRARLRRAAN